MCEKNNLLVRENREPIIDILKGITILLVVYGHTWPFCREFIYLFHMAVFMIASGLCFSFTEKTRVGVLKYVLKKVKTLYIPFVVANIAFLLLTDVFVKIGFYTDNPLFLDETIMWPVNQGLQYQLTVNVMLRAILKVFLFVGPTQMGTATWFLTVLFNVQVIHCFLVYIMRKCDQRKQKVIWLVVVIFFALSSQMISTINPTTIYALKCFPCMYLAFLMGRAIKMTPISMNVLYGWRGAVISTGILMVMSLFIRIELSSGKIDNVFAYLVASACGWCMLCFIATTISRVPKVTILFQYIGKHTMPILCLHVLSFKIVSIIYINVTQTNRLLLAAFHVIFNAGEIWKIGYLLVGV